MRYLLVATIVLVAAVALSLQAGQDTGYVAVAVGPWVVEASVVLVTGLLALGFGIGYLMVRIAIGAWNTPGGVGRWRRGRQRRQAMAGLQRGLIALAEGQHGLAERWLTRSVRHSDMAAAHYLSAARAVQGPDAASRAEHYLGLAVRAEPAALDAASVVRAELARDAGEVVRAREILEAQHARQPDNGYVTRLLAALRAEAEDWSGVLALLPAMRRQGVAGAGELDTLEVRARRGALHATAARAPGADALEAGWAEVPEHLRRRPEMLGAYVGLMLGRDRGAVLEPLLRGALARRWDDQLARLYGLVEGADTVQQLGYAESLLGSRPTNAALLLSAGRLARRARLWGKARAYLESSLGAAPSPETCQALTELLEEMGEHEQADRIARQGLGLAVGPVSA